MGGVILNLQVMRAAAALAVVCVHLDYLLAGAGVPLFGHGGVDIFFVISGYLMVHTTRERHPSAENFAVNRVIRIVPLYWLITFLVFGLALVAPSLMQATRADPVELLKSLFFIPFAKSSGLVHPVLFVGWTLNYEMFFYLIFAIGLATSRYALGLTSIAVLLCALVAYGAYAHPSGVAAAFYTNSIMLEFVYGMTLAALTPKLPVQVPLAVKALTLAVLLCGFVIAIAWTEGAGAQPRGLWAGLPAAAAIAGAVALERWGWRVTSVVGLALGDASYAIYLIHPFVTQGIQKIARALHVTDWQAMVAIPPSFVLVALVGWLLHRHVELPITRALRDFVRRRAQRPALAAAPEQ